MPKVLYFLDFFIFFIYSIPISGLAAGKADYRRNSK